MALFNVLDQRRVNEYNPEVDVVFEVFDAETHPMQKSVDDFTEWMPRVTVYQASGYAARFSASVTMYLYDPGWVGNNFGFIVILHPKIKRDPMIPHEYDTTLLRAF